MSAGVSRCACSRMRSRTTGSSPGGAAPARARCSCSARGAGYVQPLRHGRRPRGPCPGRRRRARVILPLVVLGVSRSGTTRLLRVILDRSPGIAIPDESFFVPLLARRHGRRIDAERFLDDVRAYRRSASGVSPPLAWRRGSTPEMSIGEAIAVIYEAYAETASKPRWGDKTPMYMRHLGLLDELFPDAQYVHLVRDGRDAALSFLQMPEGRTRERGRSRRHQRSSRVSGGRRCATRVRSAGASGSLGTTRCGTRSSSRSPSRSYERSARSRGSRSRRRCSTTPARSTSPRNLTNSDCCRHRRAGSGWRDDMSPVDVAAFEAVARDLLNELGYEVTSVSSGGARPALARGWYDVRLASWNAAASVVQRSPLWRRRHPRLST